MPILLVCLGVVLLALGTDVCVLHVVAGLLLRGHHVTVPANCVASFDQEMHEFALTHMEMLGAEIIR